MLIEQLPKEELDIIDSYRKIYAPSEFYTRESAQPIEKILRPWDEAKQHLYELFNHQFIYEKEICYKIADEDITRPMSELAYQYKWVDTKQILTPIVEAIYEYNKYTYARWQISSLIESLLDYGALKENRYDFSKYVLNLPALGKTLTVPNGCKPIKMLGKIIDKFNITEVKERFEELRLEHSRILNQKELKGTLCLSIHPLDYMTMSDNAAGWHTCMSWMEEEGGEYKQGTVEMMNSPYVVVAYLKSDNHNFQPFISWDSEDKREWNSKKWRQLFIIKPNYALSVKPYPYENYELTKEVLNVIKGVLGWDGPIHNFEPREENKCRGQKVKITPQTGSMYNDFGRCQHFITLNPQYKEDIDEKLVFSGVSECMYCGDTYSAEDHEWYHERMLCCEDCIEVNRCAHCGNLFSNYGDGTTGPNNQWLCYDCYYEETCEDSVTGQRIYCDNARDIILSHSNRALETGWGTDLRITTELSDEDLKSYFSEVEVEKGYWEDIYVVRPAACSEDGLALFDITEEGLKDYMVQESDF